MRSKDFYPAIFSRHARSYHERLEHLMRGGAATGRFAVMDAVRPRRGMRILDLACGPGTISIAMAQEMSGEGEVVGIDLAEGMLEVARAAALGKGLPVRFMKMDMEVLQFGAQAFDAVTCANGLQFAPNLGRVLREVRRVLKVRGTLAASIPATPAAGSSRAEEALGKLLDRRLGRASIPDDTEATRAIVGDPDRLQAAAVQAGLRAVEVDRIDSEVGWEGPAQFAASSLEWWSHAARTEGLSPHVREMLVAEATRAVEEVVGEGPFSVPATSLVLRAEA